MKSALLRLREARSYQPYRAGKLRIICCSIREDVIDLSIHELAKRTFPLRPPSFGCATASVLRASKSSAKPLPMKWRSEGKTRRPSRRKLPAPTAWRTLLRKSPTKILCPWRIQKNLLDTETLEKCVELVRGGARMVLLFGMGASLRCQGRLPEVFAAE